MVDLLKPCIKCGAIDRDKKSGRCRPCAAVKMRAYYQANIEKMLNRAPPSKEAARKYTQAWRERNPNYSYEISEQSKANKKAYSLENNEKTKNYFKEWACRNKDKMSEYQKKWKENNRDKVREKDRRHKHARRVLSKNKKLSKGLAERLFAAQNGKCACCGKGLKRGFHLDHIIPLALGGENIDRNIQLLLPLCNMKKRDKHPNQYMREMGYLI
jgi:5-methylcytosine-specific restriction endonuclease McrA